MYKCFDTFHEWDYIESVKAINKYSAFINLDSVVGIPDSLVHYTVLMFKLDEPFARTFVLGVVLLGCLRVVTGLKVSNINICLSI